MNTETQTRGWYVIVVIAVCFGYWLGRPTNKPSPQPTPKFSMTQIANGAVSVMNNSTGQVTFYVFRGDKMEVIKNPLDESFNRMLLDAEKDVSPRELTDTEKRNISELAERYGKKK